jgi:hypothetical protein
MKIFIDAIVLYKIDGKLIPIKVFWKDDRTYKIDKVLDIKKRASLKAGGYGLRYSCMINGQLRYLWLETFENGTRWFVEGK